MSETEDAEQAEQQEQIIEYWENWLGSQRMDQFVEVNLGSWSGSSVRKMAEEAGCLQFYNNVYQPFSAAVHSNWAHVSNYNTVYCENPAHRYHRIPTIINIDPDPYWLYLAAKYLEKTFNLFDTITKFSNKSPKSFDNLCDILNKFKTA